MAETRTRLIGAAVVAVILVISIALVAESWRKLEDTEVGVAYDIHQKRLSPEVKRAGLHNGSPGFKFIKFPSVFKSLDFSIFECFDYEGIEIVLDVQLQYRARSKDLREIILQFENHDNYIKVLRSIAEAVLHQTCSSLNTSQFQAQRIEFQALIHHTMAQRFHTVRADVSEVQVRNIRLPKQYEEIIRKQEEAKEKLKTVEKERLSALNKARAMIEETEIERNITIETANSKAKMMMWEAQEKAMELAEEAECEKDTYTKHKLLHTLFSHMLNRVLLQPTNNVSVAFESPFKATHL